MGRQGPRATTKTVLKSVSKLQQFDSIPNLKCKTLLNKNHPIVRLQWLSRIQILNFNNCNLCLKTHKYLGLSLSWSFCCSNVLSCSRNVIIYFQSLCLCICFLLIRSCFLITLIKSLKGHKCLRRIFLCVPKSKVTH